jgi:hypothetical protein
MSSHASTSRGEGEVKSLKQFQAALRRWARAGALSPRRSRKPSQASSSAAGMQWAQTHLPSELRMCRVSDALRQASHLKVLLMTPSKFLRAHTVRRRGGH